MVQATVALKPKPQPARREDENTYEGSVVAETQHVFEPIAKLDTESSIDPVGAVGGLRVYIPARVARDSQFPFTPGEVATVRTIADDEGTVGLLVIKKERVSSSDRFRVSSK